jgi:tellurite resistance protein TerC
MFGGNGMKKEKRGVLRQAWRLIVLVVGLTILLIGVALLVLPGPAFVVIPIGLAILATEFAWARRLLHRVKEAAEKGAEKINLRSLLRRKAEK